MEKQTRDNLRTASQNRRLHALLTQLKIDDDIKSLLVHEHSNGRTDSSAELTYIECQSLIRTLESLMGYTRRKTIEDKERADTMRKRVIKSIFGYYELQGKAVDMQYVISTAQRACGVDKLNDASIATLTRVYNEFCKKQGVINIMRHNND